MFTGRALEAFNPVKKSFNWQPQGEDIFAPSYAYWPLAHNFGISFRFLDMGLDILARPHTLRLEGALISGRSWPDVQKFLGPPAWPKEPFYGDIIQLTETGGLNLPACPPKPLFLINQPRGECLLFDPFPSSSIPSSPRLPRSLSCLN
jgi:hypothetical protein